MEGIVSLTCKAVGRPVASDTGFLTPPPCRLDARHRVGKPPVNQNVGAGACVPSPAGVPGKTDFRTLIRLKPLVSFAAVVLPLQRLEVLKFVPSSKGHGFDVINFPA